VLCTVAGFPSAILERKKLKRVGRGARVCHPRFNYWVLRKRAFSQYVQEPLHGCVRLCRHPVHAFLRRKVISDTLPSGWAAAPMQGGVEFSMGTELEPEGLLRRKSPPSGQHRGNFLIHLRGVPVF
jgi:hypothetical protein